MVMDMDVQFPQHRKLTFVSAEKPEAEVELETCSRVDVRSLSIFWLSSWCVVAFTPCCFVAPFDR